MEPKKIDRNRSWKVRAYELLKLIIEPVTDDSIPDDVLDEISAGVIFNSAEYLVKEYEKENDEN